MNAITKAEWTQRLPYTLTFQINATPKSPNVFYSSHWRTRHTHTRKWHTLVFTKVWHMKPPKPLKRAVIEMQRFSPRKMDADNCRLSFKPVLDALVKCGVIADDTMAVIGEPKVTQEKCSNKDKKIVIKITEVACEG